MPEEVIGAILEATGEAIVEVAKAAGEVAAESAKSVSEVVVETGKAVSETADAAGEVVAGVAKATCHAIGEVLDFVVDPFTTLNFDIGPQRRKDESKGEETEVIESKKDTGDQN